MTSHPVSVYDAAVELPEASTDETHHASPTNSLYDLYSHAGAAEFSRTTSENVLEETKAPPQLLRLGTSQIGSSEYEALSPSEFLADTPKAVARIDECDAWDQELIAQVTTEFASQNEAGRAELSRTISEDKLRLAKQTSAGSPPPAAATPATSLYSPATAAPTEEDDGFVTVTRDKHRHKKPPTPKHSEQKAETPSSKGGGKQQKGQKAPERPQSVCPPEFLHGMETKLGAALHRDWNEEFQSM